jgi:hypothetical protein
VLDQAVEPPGVPDRGRQSTIRCQAPPSTGAADRLGYGSAPGASVCSYTKPKEDSPTMVQRTTAVQSRPLNLASPCAGSGTAMKFQRRLRFKGNCFRMVQDPSLVSRAVARPALLRWTSNREQQRELLREATVMILYVSVVEIAELAALPEHHFTTGRVTGAVGGHLLAIVWGTAVGLAIAHWFAFGLAAPAFRGERPSQFDLQVGLAQVGGAILVAALSSLPALFLSNVRAQETTGDIPALLVGLVGYLVARQTGSSRLASVFYGITALVVGILVALVKSVLAAH